MSGSRHRSPASPRAGVLLETRHGAKRQSLGVHSFQTSCGIALPLTFKPGRHPIEKPRTSPLSPRMLEGLNISCRHLWLKRSFLHFPVLPLNLVYNANIILITCYHNNLISTESW